MSKPIDPAIAREKEKARLAKPNKGTVAHDEMAHNKLDLRSDNVNARLENPLAGISLERLQEMGRAFALEKGLEEHAEEFAKGAMVAQDPLAYESLPMLNDEDRRVLGREVTHKWDHPKALYFLVVMCSISAAVQGMDESVTNGANLFWAPQFGLDTDPATAGAAASNNQWLLGLTAGAPYLCCAVLGCWLTAPLNNWFGRRGAIFITATLSALTCIWGACTNSWQHLFVSRLVLGLGIGPKSATVPVYGAETAPPLIRGALVMQWQVWTAFGIMLGTVSSLAFYKVPDPTNAAITGLNWRLMLGSAAFPAFFVMAQVYFCPESPRWLIGKGRYGKAYESLCRLRHTKLQAARDLFMINALLEEEASISTGRSAIVEMFAVARNRRAALASGIVMFMQQFCGINVIAYYSSTIFRQAGFGEIEALGATLGFGALNWIAAAPALYTIDTFGRRALLLTTFPIMSLALLIVALSFLIEAQTARTAMTATFVYVHCIAYSPGEGPVPFTYSAEAFPLYIRDVGMSYATALTWLFNFILALTFPRLLDAFTPSGAFGWYAAWNMIGWTLVLFFVPETKSLTLEELDQVFSVPTKSHAAYQARQVPYFIGKYIMRKDMGSPEQLYHWENPSIERVQSIPHFTGVRGDMQALRWNLKDRSSVPNLPRQRREVVSEVSEQIEPSSSRPFGMSYATALTWLFNVGFITGLNWRLMLGSAAFPAFFVMAQVYFCPESPRWLIGKGRYGKAYEPLCRLRHTKLQAARDLYRINALLEEEASISTGRSAIVEMFAVARNRRAALASGIVMFMQQFCGINVIAYYSSTIFRQAGFGEIEALGATLGFGALNWIAAACIRYGTNLHTMKGSKKGTNG